LIKVSATNLLGPLSTQLPFTAWYSVSHFFFIKRKIKNRFDINYCWFFDKTARLTILAFGNASTIKSALRKALQDTAAVAKTNLY